MTGEFITTTQAFYDLSAPVYPRLRDIEPAFDRLAVFYNPASRHADDTSADIARLQANEPVHKMNVSSYETSPHLADNIAALKETITPTTVIAIRAGDGGVSEIMNAALALHLDNPVQVIPAGNANDLAHQLYGRRDYSRPERVLGRGVVRELRPLHVNVTEERGEHTVFNAFAYVSQGISANTAQTFNSSDYKDKRAHRWPGGTFTAERLTAVKEFLRADSFTLATDGEDSSIIDLIAANGARMAKNFKPRAELLQPEARIITARNKFAGIVTIGALVTGIPVPRSELLTPEDQLSYEAEGSPNVLMQVDGEHYTFAGRIAVELSIAKQGVSVLTTRK